MLVLASYARQADDDTLRKLVARPAHVRQVKVSRCRLVQRFFKLR